MKRKRLSMRSRKTLTPFTIMQRNTLGLMKKQDPLWITKEISTLTAKTQQIFSKPRESYQYENIDYDCDTMNEVYFTRENILKQINKLNNKGSPGPDGVVARCYKYGEEFILDALIDIYNQMRDECYSPQKSREAWISPVWKGVDKMKAD